MTWDLITCIEIQIAWNRSEIKYLCLFFKLFRNNTWFITFIGYDWFIMASIQSSISDRIISCLWQFTCVWRLHGAFNYCKLCILCAQIRGITILVDLSHLSIKRVIKLGHSFVRKCSAVSNKAVPLRVSQILIVHGGHVFNAIHRMTSVFLSDKIKMRVQNCGSDVNRLIQSICGDGPQAKQAAAKMLPRGPEFDNIGKVTNASYNVFEELMNFDEMFRSNITNNFIDGES